MRYITKFKIASIMMLSCGALSGRAAAINEDYIATATAERVSCEEQMCLQSSVGISPEYNVSSIFAYKTAADSVANKNAEYARLRREAMSQSNEGEIEFDDDDEVETPKVYSHRNEGHFIFGGLGYGNITSEVINNWYSGSPTNGLEWQLGYEWISDKKIGVGALYSGYAAWGKESTGGSSYVKDMLYINYIAPQFVVKFGSQKSKWSFAASLGLGVGIETQDCKTTGGQGIYRASKAGFGINESMRVEFAPSARFRLYAMASAITCYISQPELRNHSDKKTGGYARLSIAIGVMHNW